MNTSIVTEMEVKTWTVKIGVGPKTGEEFIKAINNAGMNIYDGNNGKTLLSPGFEVSHEEFTLELVDVTPAELGFRDGATSSQIVSRARLFGLGICPAEVGPQFRLQYPNQDFGAAIIVAMKPIVGEDNRPRWFYLMYDKDDGVPNLFANYGEANNLWRATDRILFVFKKRPGVNPAEGINGPWRLLKLRNGRSVIE